MNQLHQLSFKINELKHQILAEKKCFSFEGKDSQNETNLASHGRKFQNLIDSSSHINEIDLYFSNLAPLRLYGLQLLELPS